MSDPLDASAAGNNTSTNRGAPAAAAASSPQPRPSMPSRRSRRWRVQLGLLQGGGDVNDDDLLAVRTRREEYERQIAEHPFPDLGGEEGNDDEGGGGGNESDDDGGAAAPPDLDPLTAMVMEEKQKTDRMRELDLKYRKERARRKRVGGGRAIEDEDYDENAATLQIIDKDLHRLLHPTASDHGGSAEEADADEEAARKEVLRRVLFLFHCLHPQLGYRQGMHEISSYLLHALEVDADDAAGDAEDAMSLGSETYAMLELILMAISPAYDHPVDGGNAGKPLEEMSRNVMGHVGRVDAQLCGLIRGLNVPGPVFLSKWVRLLFSREVNAVMELWDAFFDLTSSNLGGGGGHTWMAVLEATAAARLLHRRSQMLRSQDPLHLLMNLPVEDDIEPILEMVHPLLAGQAVSLPPVHIPPPTPTPHQQVPATQQQQMNSNPLHQTPASAAAALQDNLGDALSASMKRFNLNRVTEKIASKTQSISKRLYDEWEAMAAERASDDPLLNNARSYDDDVWHSSSNNNAYHPTDPLSQPRPAASAASNVYVPTAAHQQVQLPPPQQQQQQLPTPSFSPQQWGQEMELQLAIIQNFCMTLEKGAHDGNREQKVVPGAVWGALADLEVLRQDITNYHHSAAAQAQAPGPGNGGGNYYHSSGNQGYNTGGGGGWPNK